MNKQTITIILIFFCLNFITPAHGIPEICVLPNCPISSGGAGRINMLAIERSPIPASLLGKTFYHNIPQSANGSEIICGVNAMCASFPTPQTGEVIGWIGFEYQDADGDLFVTTSGEEAIKIDDSNYALALWDKRHFWISIDENSVPMAIQPRYATTDILTGHEIYVVDYLGYKKQGVDYSAYQFEMSVSSLVIEVDPSEGSVQDLYVDYYDENNSFVESIDINNGDEIITLFLGLDKISPDTVTFFALEDLTVVTETPELFYEEWYPGVTFPCTYCGDLDLSQVSFKYIFESLEGFPRTNFTDPLAIIDEIVFRNDFE